MLDRIKRGSIGGISTERPPDTFGAAPPASSELVLVLPSTASGPPQTSAGANAELSVVP